MSKREVTYAITVSDPFDGMLRLLCDAQRFGFDLITLKLDRPRNGECAIAMTLSIPDEADAGHIGDRFNRHGTVTRLHAASAVDGAKAFQHIRAIA